MISCVAEVALRAALGSSDGVESLVPQSAQTDARGTAEQLIAATRQQSAEYPLVLASHLPMLLEIHCRLGASAQRLVELANHYTPCKQVPRLAAAVAPITRDNWLDALGDRSRECDYRRFFALEAQRMGAHAAIRRYLPRLARGIGARALYGLIGRGQGVLRAEVTEVG